MKRKNQYVKSLMTTLALVLTLVGAVVFRDKEPGVVPPFPELPVVGDEVPETEEDDCVDPLSDKGDRTTKFEA